VRAAPGRPSSRSRHEGGEGDHLHLLKGGEELLALAQAVRRVGFVDQSMAAWYGLPSLILLTRFWTEETGTSAAAPPSLGALQPSCSPRPGPPQARPSAAPWGRRPPAGLTQASHQGVQTLYREEVIEAVRSPSLTATAQATAGLVLANSRASSTIFSLAAPVISLTRSGA